MSLLAALTCASARNAEQVVARPEFIVGARVEFVSPRTQQLMRGTITRRSPLNMLEATEEQRKDCAVSAMG